MCISFVCFSLSHFEESGFGKNPVWWAFVAEYNGKVVGMALYYVRYSTWKGQRMYLEDLLVTEEMRGKKIGSLLFEALIQEAKDKKGNFKYEFIEAYIHIFINNIALT